MIVDTKSFRLIYFYANDSRFHEASYLLEHSVSSLIELGVAILTNSSNLVILALIGISLGHPSRSSISFILGSGLLLLFAGEWILALKLLGISIVAPFAMSIVMLPSIAFAGPGAALLENDKKFFGNILLWISMIYLGMVFGFYSSTILFYVFDNSSTFWGRFSMTTSHVHKVTINNKIIA